MDHFEKYHFNQMLSRTPLAANGNNFGEWFHHMVGALKSAGKIDVLTPMDSHDENHGGPHMFCDECIVKELMHACIEPQLGGLFEDMRPFRLMEVLKARFIHQVRAERYNLRRELINIHLELGEPIQMFEIRVAKLEEKLRQIGSPVGHEFLCDTVLAALPPAYHAFGAMYNRMADEWPVQMLFALLKEAGADIQNGDLNWTKTCIRVIHIDIISAIMIIGIGY